MSFNIDVSTLDRENEGVWAMFKGSEFLIASSGSTKFQRMFSKLQMPHRKAIDKKKLDPEVQLDIMARSMSNTLLIDWRGVVDNSGNEVKFSVDSAYKVLKNNAEFRDFVTEAHKSIQYTVTNLQGVV